MAKFSDIAKGVLAGVAHAAEVYNATAEVQRHDAHADQFAEQTANAFSKKDYKGMIFSGLATFSSLTRKQEAEKRLQDLREF